MDNPFQPRPVSAADVQSMIKRAIQSFNIAGPGIVGQGSDWAMANPNPFQGMNQASAKPGNHYPWIGDKYDKDSGDYWIWFGNATGSFIGKPANYIEKMNLSIGTEDTTAYFNLLLGDDSPSDDIMFWSHNSNSFRLSVYDYPQVELKDSSDNALKLSVSEFPQILLSDVYSDPYSANFIEIDLDVGPEITLGDETGKRISLDLTDLPNIMIWELTSDNSIKMNIDAGPQLYLFDGSQSIDINIETGPLAHFADDSGNFIKIDLTGSPEIEIFDTDGNVGTTILDGNSLSLTDGVSGNTLAVDVGVPSLEIVVDTDTTTLGDGDLHMSSPDGSVSIGAESENGKIVVGASKLSDGDIDLGATGSVTINSIVYEPTQIMDCNGSKLWILADTTGWTT